jgi:hypothetical protein
MAKPQQVLTVVLALIAGMIGGAVSSHFLGSAFAEKWTGVQEVVRARLFELVDKSGQPRAVLNLDEDNPVLALLDKEKKKQVWLEARPDGAVLILHGEEHSKAFMQTRFGGASLGFNSKEGYAIQMDTKPDGVSIILYDKEYNPRSVLGNAELKLESGCTEVRAPSSMMLFDEEGKVLFSAP